FQLGAVAGERAAGAADVVGDLAERRLQAADHRLAVVGQVHVVGQVEVARAAQSGLLLGVLGGRGPHAAVRIEPGRALPLGIAVGVVRLLRNRVAAVLGRQVVLVGPGALEVVELDHVHPVRADRLAARALGVGAQHHVGHVGADVVDVRPVGQRRGVVAVGVVALGISEPFGHEVVRDVAVAAVIGVLVVGGRVADAEEHVGLAAVQDRVGIAADRGVGGPAGHRGVGAGAVPVLDDRHAVGIAVAILGAAGQVAVGRQV